MSEIDTTVLWAIQLPMKLDTDTSEWAEAYLAKQNEFVEELEALAAKYGGTVKTVDSWGKVDT